MKIAIVSGMCCEGCAKEVKHIFKHIYGISKVSVSIDDSTVVYEGYVSKRIIEEAFLGTSYKLIEVKKL